MRTLRPSAAALPPTTATPPPSTTALPPWGAALRAIVVVVPARDEEALVGKCLTSLLAAARFARTSLGRGMPLVRIVLVADSCRDRTAEIARGFSGVQVVTTDAGSVGAARRLGVEVALAPLRLPQATVWIANTDADSEVPPNWLTDQVDIAARGGDVMVGTVRPRFADLTPAQVRAWQATRTPGVANGHVHGANLGVRASAYRAAGGFPDAPLHEDVELVSRLVAADARVVATDSSDVLTSGRRVGRAPGGYSTYLATSLAELVD